MTDVGELIVRIRADTAELEKAMRDAKGSVEGGSSAMRRSIEALKDAFRELVPILSVAALVKLGKDAVEAAEHMNNLAQRIGFSASTLSALEGSLRKAGSNLDEFSSSINRMNDLIGEAAKGTNQEAVKAFDALGLSVRKLQAMNPEQQFYAIAKALAEAKTQAQFTNEGVNIFGKTFAAIGPSIKESNGNLKEHVETMKRLNEAVSPESLKTIEEFGNRLTEAGIKAKNEWLEVYAAIAKAIMEVSDFVSKTDTAGAYGMAKLGITPQPASPRGTVSTERPQVMSDQDVLAKLRQAYGLDKSSNPAAGGNADLLRPKDSSLKEYIANLKLETAAVGQSERALAVQRAEIEAAAKAKDDYNNHLRASKELLPSEKAEVEQLAGAYYDLKTAQEENARIARHMKEALADSLADIAVNFDNLRDTATSAIQAIAKEIIKAKLTQPLANSIIDSMPSFSFGNLLGFADGGSPPVGRPSIVGENGPELFVPNTAGTVVPNSRLGGTMVSQTLVFNMQPGLAGTVAAEIQNAVPYIAAQAHASVFQAIQRGGPESRIVGKRS